MDNEEILSSLEEHLKGIKQTITTALLAAFIFCGAGFSQSADRTRQAIVLFEITIPFDYVQYVAVWLFMMLNASLFDKLLRVRKLVLIVPDSHFGKAFSKLALFPFFANPYAYFGESLSARVSSNKGFGALIIIWWVCNSSIYLLAGDYRDWFFMFSVGVFVLFGLLSIYIIKTTWETIVTRTKELDTDLHTNLKRSQKVRDRITSGCILIGCSIALLILLVATPTITD